MHCKHALAQHAHAHVEAHAAFTLATISSSHLHSVLFWLLPVLTWQPPVAGNELIEEPLPELH